MKLCTDSKKCPYQSAFDTLWELEATDPGLCEGFLSEPNSKCLLHPQNRAKDTKLYEEIENDKDKARR